MINLPTRRRRRANKIHRNRIGKESGASRGLQAESLEDRRMLTTLTFDPVDSPAFGPFEFAAIDAAVANAVQEDITSIVAALPDPYDQDDVDALGDFRVRLQGVITSFTNPENGLPLSSSILARILGDTPMMLRAKSF